MEPFCVILHRTLSTHHPLHQILKYHCRDVTVPNTLGTVELISEGGYIDKLFAFGNKGTERILTDVYPLSTWDVTDFRGELKVRRNSHCMPIVPRRAMGIQAQYLESVWFMYKNIHKYLLMTLYIFFLLT